MVLAAAGELTAPGGRSPRDGSSPRPAVRLPVWHRLRKYVRCLVPRPLAPGHLVPPHPWEPGQAPASPARGSHWMPMSLAEELGVRVLGDRGLALLTQIHSGRLNPPGWMPGWGRWGCWL